MDIIHRPEQREEISEKIHLKTYFDGYAKLIHEGRPENLVDFRKLSGNRMKLLIEGITIDVKHEDIEWKIDDDTFNQIARNCNVNNLTVEGESPVMKICLGDDEATHKFEVVPVTPAARSRLKTLQNLDKASDEETRKRILNLRNSNDIWFEAAPEPPEKIKPGIFENEIVVTVRVYRPIKNHPRQPASSFRYSQEIVLLGSSTLSQLRDFIKCPVDYTIPDDVSENPFAVCINQVTGKQENCWDSKMKNKDVYKSGFIYVEGCFYNDMRWPECHDYSEVIRDWASHLKKQLGPFTTAKMEETIIQDLTIRFGYPYVYGDHEHLISFMSAHLLSVDDPQTKRDYPFERSVGLVHSKYCIICNSKVAKWITSGNTRVPEEPFFFCGECFKDFNYDKDGIKKCDFKAYNYIEPNAL